MATKLPARRALKNEDRRRLLDDLCTLLQIDSAPEGISDGGRPARAGPLPLLLGPVAEEPQPLAASPGPRAVIATGRLGEHPGTSGLADQEFIDPVMYLNEAELALAYALPLHGHGEGDVSKARADHASRF